MEDDVKIISKKIKGTNRHWKNFVDKDYLGAHNLEDGEEMLLTIAKFQGEETIKTADGEKKQVVIYFKEDVPKMILNTGNGDMIGKMYGMQPENWIGKQVYVYKIKGVKAFGKVQDALRIRDKKPTQALDITQWTAKLDVATTLDELGKIWNSFTLSVKSNKAIEAHKNQLKNKLTPAKE